MKHRGDRSGAGPLPVLLVLGAVLLAVIVTVGLLGPRHLRGEAPPAAVPASPSGTPGTPGSTLAAPAGQDAAAADLQRTVDHVLRARNRAADGRAAAEPAGALLDVAPALRGDQVRLLRNLAVIPFSSWRLRAAGDVPTAALRRGRVPETVHLHYRLPGDVAVQRSTVRATFVRRHGRWLLAGWHPQRPQLWDVGPVHVVRRGPVLVLGSAGGRRLAVVAAATRQALTGVAAAWPYAWSRRATVIVPGDRRDMAALLDLPRRDLDGLGAVTTSESAAAPVRGAVRVTVNPSYVWDLSPLARQILLRHELTHVAQYGLGARRLRGVPTWLSEGVAEYLGYRGRGVPFDVVASDLLDEVSRGRVPALPTDAAFDFASAERQRTLAYRAGWTFCVFLADRAGGDAPFRLFRAVASGRGSEHARVAAAVRRVTGRPLHAVVRDWHVWLRGLA